MEMHGQRLVMKFSLLAREKIQSDTWELIRVIGEAAVSFSTLRRWCRGFKQGHFSLDGELGPGGSLVDIGEAVSQFLQKDPFISASSLAKRPAISSHTIK
jgi:ABC-type uncharacterized transport system YnjBCD ATPase subunit